MKRLFLVAAGFAAAIASLLLVQHLRLSTSAELPDRQEGALRFATWNVHYILTRQAEGRWGLSGWDARKAPLDQVFKALDADIVAFQEMESFGGGNDDTVNLKRSWLLERNPSYTAAAIGPWRIFPSTQPILYRHARLTVRDQGWFFFSDTPDTVYARGFDGAPPSFASWVQFEDRDTGQSFRVVNVHFDAASRGNRRQSAALTATRVAEWISAGERVILGGDLNALSGAWVLRRLEAAGLTFAPARHASFHLDRGLHLFGAIDHIGVSAGVGPVEGPHVLQRRVGPAWPADHHPVVADIALGAR